MPGACAAVCRSLVAPALLSGNTINASVGRGFTRAADDPWARVPDILKRIKPPVFPKRDFDITRHGAVGDGKSDCTEAFRKAVAACSKSGGGRVVVKIPSWQEECCASVPDT